ncbi:hypothetical protein AXG93_2035s1140 [Marchantia polymorpha subsp. ruderalis]|uniref:Uncharacterized protein n=1 Tax=Marchantia polymorpha subsp. ruderalis TaxID=1480154 RepID=A0A176VQR4_MARPO|nr:hypothetical protein AXG93_2035s1140 [Marchantia polymorpha subsp. ruderalis]
MRKFEQEEAAMVRPIRLSALKVLEAGLQAHRCELILVKIEFLLWGWNWTSEAIVQEWDKDGSPKPPGYGGNPETWLGLWNEHCEEIAFTRRTSSGWLSGNTSG